MPRAVSLRRRRTATPRAIPRHPLKHRTNFFSFLGVRSELLEVDAVLFNLNVEAMERSLGLQ